MSAVTRLTTQSPSAYAPGAHATHLSEVTVQAVDEIGSDTADQMEATANSIEAVAAKLAGKIMGDAKETAGELRKKAAEHRERNRKMTQDVSDYCLWNTAVQGAIRSIPFDVKDRIKPVECESDDGEPSPRFLHRPIDVNN